MDEFSVENFEDFERRLKDENYEYKICMLTVPIRIQIYSLIKKEIKPLIYYKRIQKSIVCAVKGLEKNLSSFRMKRNIKTQNFSLAI